MGSIDHLNIHIILVRRRLDVDDLGNKARGAVFATVFLEAFVGETGTVLV